MAWAGFVFTHTAGDPTRGERIAAAVLADDAARAEVAAPITAAIMRSTGLPPDQQPFVADQVDRLLLQRDGRQAFADVFAGAWARMLGADDARGTTFDVTPFLDDVAAALPGFDSNLIPTESAVPADVPVPADRGAWLGSLRRAVDAAILPLALVAVVGVGSALVLGDRGWVLRRVGVWAVLAGGGWLLVPALAVWGTRRWATGADSVVAAGVDAAVSGLRPAAIALVAGGVAAFVLSFAGLGLGPLSAGRPAPRRANESFGAGARARNAAPRAAPAGAPRASASPAGPARPVPVDRWEPGPRTVAPTQELTYRPPPRRPSPTPSASTAAPRATDATDDDHDALWDFYTDPGS